MTNIEMYYEAKKREEDGIEDYYDAAMNNQKNISFGPSIKETTSENWGKSTSETTSNNLSRFTQLAGELAEIYAKKNADYGNSFDKSLDEDGLLVAKIRLMDKMNRFNSLIKNPAQVNDESIEDTLKDMANYAIMTAMWIRANIPGKAEWASDIKSLTGRGLDVNLIDELWEMGPKAASEIRALTQLTDSELTQYSNLWKRKKQIATEGLEGPK